MLTHYHTVMLPCCHSTMPQCCHATTCFCHALVEAVMLPELVLEATNNNNNSCFCLSFPPTTLHGLLDCGSVAGKF